MQVHKLDRRKTTHPKKTSEKPQQGSTKAVDSQCAVDEINAYIAIRDNLLAEAEATTTSANLHRLSLANHFVQSCLKPASRSPYKAQYLPERNADRERKRCVAVKIRIAELDMQIAL
jgi:hypothetical protein